MHDRMIISTATVLLRHCWELAHLERTRSRGRAGDNASALLPGVVLMGFESRPALLSHCTCLYFVGLHDTPSAFGHAVSVPIALEMHANSAQEHLGRRERRDSESALYAIAGTACWKPSYLRILWPFADDNASALSSAGARGNCVAFSACTVRGSGEVDLV
jgi:hypothetical protein